MTEAPVSRALYDHGFARVAACTIRTAIADPDANRIAIAQAAADCHAASASVALFPELALSGYAIDDLLLQDVLLDAVRDAAIALIDESRNWMPVLVVGAPILVANRLYNTALVIHRGRLLGVVPKTYLPTYREFYEARHFASGADAPVQEIVLGPHTAPFGTDLLFQATDMPSCCLGIEICEDLWVPQPPSGQQALAGATILLNPSASPITVGRAGHRAMLCQAQSARCQAAYVYTAAGVGESTTDLAWDGQSIIFENGVKLAESERFADTGHCLFADLDLDLLRQERLRMGSFDDNRFRTETTPFRTVPLTLDPPKTDIGFHRRLNRFPFVPSDPARLAQDCFEAVNIQVAGLSQRLRATGTEKLVIGVSGGLDSTLALLVCVQTMARLGLGRSNILAYTMPGFATGTASKQSALALMQQLGVTAGEIDIKPAALRMLQDMQHPFAAGQPVHDIAFENVQAGLRTDYLFRLANQNHALVAGTGDLSELALGWCTYGVGDQMSHYNVNAGVPKTLIQHLIRWMIADGQFSAPTAATLKQILAAEISPELIPAKDDEKPQSTEAFIGPYELQDFNLFYTLRYGFRPSKIAFLANRAWEDLAKGDWPPAFPEDQRRAYTQDQITHWLTVFLRRFFGTSQFKRSAMPNGPKIVAGGALSPRGEWRAPSDGNAHAWLRSLKGE